MNVIRVLVSSIIDLQKSLPNRPHYLLSSLIKKGHQVTVISLRDRWKETKSKVNNPGIIHNTIKKINNIYITDRSISPILQEFCFPLFKKSFEIKKIVKNYDIHFNYNSLMLGYMISKYCTKYKIPTVFDIADGLEEMILRSPQIPTFPLRRIGSVIGRLILKINIKNSSLTTLTCLNLAKHYKIPESKYLIIPNGVDLNNFTYKKEKGEEIRKKLGINEDETVLCFIGALREWIDFSQVFLAIKKMLNNGIKVRMLIGGKEGFFKENQILARRILPSEAYFFIGHIPVDKVPDYISAADICLIPFKRGNISNLAVPLKLFEYMACNKPIISSFTPTLSNIAKSRIFFANKDNEYISSIKSIMKDINEVKIQTSINRKWVEERYDWKNLGDRMVKILETIVDQSI